MASAISLKVRTMCSNTKAYGKILLFKLLFIDIQASNLSYTIGMQSKPVTSKEQIIT